MLMLKEDHYKDISYSIQEHLYLKYFSPIKDVLDKYYGKFTLKNSLVNLEQAIEDRLITFDGKEFTGVFKSTVSKELKEFATFDNKTKSFVLNDGCSLPDNIRTTVFNIDNANKKIKEELDSIINKIESEELEDVVTPIGTTVDSVKDGLDEDLNYVGLKVTLTKEQKDNIIKDYNDNINLSIKDWDTDQITRLRGLVLNIQETGFDKMSLKDIIQKEWGVTENKAKFLARQETSLFLAKFRREQSKSAGINKYRWSTSLDEDVRPKGGTKTTAGNNHRMLHGKVFTYGDPPIVDTKTGRRAEPGEDYWCRCTAIPVVD